MLRQLFMFSEGDGYAMAVVVNALGGARGGVGGVPDGWRALSCAGRGKVVSYLGGLRLDLTGTRERTVDLTHVGG